MSKTITIRLDEKDYEIIKNAAEGDRRSISNYIEVATLSYITDHATVSDREMNEIIKDEKLVKELRKGKQEIKKGKYRLV